MMNIVFMGTPSFAVAALKALATDEDRRFSVELVITRPDAASGRGATLLPSPVRLSAEELGIPTQTPRSFYVYVGEELDEQRKREGGLSPFSGRRPLFDTRGNRVIDAELLARIAAVEPDVIVVAAYGMILPRQVLDLPRYGCVNIHASLLPRWRGSAPIQRAILAGDEQSGISIMRMEEGLDTGAVCSVAPMPIRGKYVSEVTEGLATLGAELLVETLPRLAEGNVTWTAQDESQVTYADKIEKRELALDPLDAAERNIRRVLASSPQAPARCAIAGRFVTVLVAQPFTPSLSSSPSASSVTPAGFLSVGEAGYFDKRLVLGTADGAFEVTALKPDGKREMAAAAFAAGVRELQKDAQIPTTWNAL
ncbi:MAG: methionyl-tRNA formyltransferase [Coriobacteriales bacterium]|jgi:methionyl-tRNA formyltransferase|nr:methionyl-tRNA formyltransferase [Coriobacteriales bacterium]